MINQQQRFLLPKLNIRGVIVGLSSSWQEVLARRPYSEEITNFLGELTVSTLLITAHLKFQGKVTVQFQGNSDSEFAVVQANHLQEFRSLAKIENSSSSLKELIEKGTLTVSIDQDSVEKVYQGVVSTNSICLSKCIENYFNQSEQIKTTLSLRADDSFACGIILQELPDSDISEDQWRRLKILIDTLEIDEFSQLENAQTMLERIFAEDDIIIYQPEEISFKCSCSDERTLGMVNSLTLAELESILKEGKALIITCDFCGKEYSHDIPVIKALADHKKHPH